MAVARHRLGLGHGQMMRLMMSALREEADEAEAADAGDGLGIVRVLCHNRQAQADRNILRSGRR